MALRQGILPSNMLRIRERDVTWDDATIEPHTIGSYKGNNVLIKWKMRDENWKMKRIERDMLDRVDNIARLLRNGTKPDTLRTLLCQGFFEDVKGDGSSRFGFVFQIPPPQRQQVIVRSLRELFEDCTIRPNLGDRFQLARSIAVSVLTLHVCGWLHKAVRSHNILFFPNTGTDIPFSEPYLCGFEYSRADAADEVTEPMDAHPEFERYRHPDSEGLPVDTIPSTDQNANPGRSYKKEFDIYSLGIILAEIHRWTPATSWREARDAEDATGFRDALVQQEGSELGFSMREGYKNAVLKCLKGDFDLSEGKCMELALYLEVVSELDRCHA